MNSLIDCCAFLGSVGKALLSHEHVVCVRRLVWRRLTGKKGRGQDELQWALFYRRGGFQAPEGSRKQQGEYASSTKKEMGTRKRIKTNKNFPLTLTRVSFRLTTESSQPFWSRHGRNFIMNEHAGKTKITIFKRRPDFAKKGLLWVAFGDSNDNFISQTHAMLWSVGLRWRCRGIC